jgi:hypothetical protein
MGEDDGGEGSTVPQPRPRGRQVCAALLLGERAEGLPGPFNSGKGQRSVALRTGSGGGALGVAAPLGGGGGPGHAEDFVAVSEGEEWRGGAPVLSGPSGGGMGGADAAPPQPGRSGGGVRAVPQQGLDSGG